MSSFLKHVDPTTGKIIADDSDSESRDTNEAQDTPATPSATEALIARINDAREAATRTMLNEFATFETTATAAINEASSDVARLTRELAGLRTDHENLRAEHNTLKETHTEAERKLAVLHDLKERLAGL